MVNSDDLLHLSPIDNTREAIEHFQSVVSEVFAHEGDGYEVFIVRSNQQYPFDLSSCLLLTALLASVTTWAAWTFFTQLRAS